MFVMFILGHKLKIQMRQIILWSLLALLNDARNETVRLHTWLTLFSC